MNLFSNEFSSFFLERLFVCPKKYLHKTNSEFVEGEARRVSEKTLEFDDISIPPSSQSFKIGQVVSRQNGIKCNLKYFNAFLFSFLYLSYTLIHS
jgi:hypothetical protein